ncbi:hypothetical protein LOTGIDRAFT_194714 [Lottia gigantea]|uniref:5-formyltetrahydrofolate cyclo-ligase n=1 Tax=Lottia gigantea TaxID=225164 RepID=V3Z7P5_LOTGI|nr:hypothetical protein LOTGIDRAFT_194714 [Lottia gigantea]ESO86833.1 hypothetical protein LOTGIDRAFT_194714 [Lottia gigantea]
MNMARNSLQQAKKLLRKEMKAKLSEMTEAAKVTESGHVVADALSHEFYVQSQRVSIFLSMADEIHTGAIVKDLLYQQKMCFIPYYHGPEMAMLELKSMEDLKNLPETKWKIKQPASKEGRLDALKSGGLDLVFVPGLAFTKSGARLGRGKGYYDKFLKECEKMGQKPKTLGLAFQAQMCEEVPTSEDDVFLDEVIHM